MPVNPPYQWQVVRANLDPTLGSEQAGTRPVLIVSTELVNAVLSIVTVLPLTSEKPGRYIYPSEVLLPANAAGQPNDSIVMAHQVRAVDKARLIDAVGILTDEALRDKVRNALRNYFEL